MTGWAETERGRHGRPGDPVRAEAKSSTGAGSSSALPKVRPETPPRSVSVRQAIARAHRAWLRRNHVQTRIDT